MKIAIDISPLQTGHSIRGVGFYLERLKSSLVQYFPEHNYIFFSNRKEIPSDTDIIHFPYFDPFQITLPNDVQKKVVVTVHDLTPLVFPQHFPAGIKGYFRWQIQKRRLKNIDGIITDSAVSKRDIIRLTGIVDSKVEVVHLAAGEEFINLKNDKAKSKHIREKYNLPEKYLLYVGDVTWNKNLPRLIEVAIELDIPLVMAGKALVQNDFDRSNPWNKDLVRIQELTQDAKKIYRLGFVPTDELVVLYNTATAFVWPSVYEGFGLPLLEAMKCGCPVITTREGCMPEIAGDAAYYFDGYDSKSLYNAIKTVFYSESLQNELVKKGFRQAEKYNWQKTAQETINVYKKVMVQ